MSTPTTNTALDKRRTKFVAAGEAAAESERTLAAVDQRLDANAQLRDAAKAELKAAALRRKELNAQLKALAKQREELRDDRTQAKRDVKKSRRSVKVTEARFDQELLKDVLRKAKSADLTAHAAVSVAEPGAVASVAPAKANRAPQRRAASTAGRRRAGAVAPARRGAATTNGRSAPN